MPNDQPKSRQRPKVGVSTDAAARIMPTNERRLRPVEADALAPKPKPARSSAMMLAGEVDRLLQELQQTRMQLAELAARADTDPLLEVFNRRGFERELTRSLAYVKRYGTRAALLFLDLDGFKQVNDRHGHAAGDAVLKAVAAALTRKVRASDTVARIGGDEFAVLLWNLDEISAAAKAEALEAEIARISLPFNSAVLTITASAGAVMLGPLDSPAEATTRADHAMYARKAARQAYRR